MTTLTFHVSRSIAATLQPGDEIVVTGLDHQANVDPWLAVAARGMGDIDDAWNAAVAAWVRSRLSPEAEKLRTDLDRLMTQALIPERSRTVVARDQQEALSALTTEWELLKGQWK